MFSRLMKDKKDEHIIFPKEFQKINQKLPDDFGLPDNTLWLGMRTERTSAMLFCFPVSEKASMPFDDNERIIREQHRDMGENEGLIEVKNGLTKKGRKYVYNIFKHSMMSERGIPQGNEYTLNINIKFENSIQFINSSFAECGITGERDALGMIIYSKSNNIDIDKALETWQEDPYDLTYKKGFLMNRSEQEKYDEIFPWHPLSEARKFLRFIAENN